MILERRHIKKFITIITLLFFSGRALAQQASAPSTPKLNNSEILERLRDLNDLKNLNDLKGRISRKEFRNLRQVESLDVFRELETPRGPDRYQVSLSQGAAFKSSHTTIIVHFPPGDEKGSDKLLDGSKAQPQEFPWEVALLNSRYGTLFCGGTYIGDGWIVTAAHCVYDGKRPPLKKEDVMILAGTTSLIKGGSRVSLIADPVIHENWNPKTKQNDIALMKITEIVDIPAALLADSTVEAAVIPPLIISGWGLTTEDGNISIDLLKAEIPIVPLDTCNQAYDGRITASQICAGQTGRDSCQGDSGGPLTGIDRNGRVLLGVVSYGFGCGQSGYPGIYTRVSAQRAWLAKITGR